MTLTDFIEITYHFSYYLKVPKRKKKRKLTVKVRQEGSLEQKKKKKKIRRSNTILSDRNVSEIRWYLNVSIFTLRYPRTKRLLVSISQLRE